MSPVVIDIHCHVHVDEADELVTPFRVRGQEPMIDFASPESAATQRRMLCTIQSKLSRLDERLPDMDAAGIDIQLISPSPSQYFYWAPPEVAARTSRMVNDWIADRVNAHSIRFVGLGTVPLQETALAVAELRRCVRQLGLKGVEISTIVGSDELSCERLRPFFAEAEALGAFIFIHPNGYAQGSRLGKHHLINLIGNPLETSIAASRLIFDGTMRDFPKLKICLAHGGGFLGAYPGRMDHAHRHREDCRTCIAEPPSQYLRKFYFDTVVYTPHQIECLCEEYGADHVLLGTDYPYDMGEPDPCGLINATKLEAATKALIAGGNALRLLGLTEEQAAAAVRSGSRKGGRPS